ncbi:S-adenosyl-L-methionine-dependent methyltransferase [Boletus edulis BED1]|uniref:S-adenosyl-L-methionine-dependent methyltransferase n=1 Tax=Boletus edulis BED1 TaxID=1328754 RepID=A0AAD4GBB6_BOLED|nr:S-adenosyl-L-methionine-dependent methyltransferase [Boletus edulis BED1]
MLTATMSAHSYPRLDIFSDDSDSDAESDRYSEMSLDASVASTKTSLDESMRSASPAPSVFSFTSSLRAQAYRQEYGRGLNNYSEVYRLPADEEELDRLDKQHTMFCKVMGKYPPPMPQIMADDGFEVKAILDLGCGSGSWIMDVAREFPHCSAVAVDLVPMQSLSMPPNCRSEVDDINLGLEHFYGDFNAVHCQLISSGIRDYRGLINHISHVLRPGGLIDLTEFAFSFTGLDKQPLLPPAGTFHPPWTPLFMSYVNRAVKERGGDAEASTHMYEWVSTHPAFEDVVHRPFWIPCSPWMSGNDPVTKFWNEVGATMRDDIQAFFRSSRPLLLGHGLGEVFVDTMTRNACEELDEAVTPVYVLIDNVYARKRH